MAANIGIRVKSNRALQNWAKNVIPHFENTLRAATQAVGFAAATRAQANAPIDKGPLRRSLETRNQPDVKMDGGGSPQAEFFVTASEPYALKMHEELQPFGEGRFQLGPFSRAQPTTREGGVGGKYLERAILKNIKRFEEFLGKAVQENLGGAAKSTKVKVTPLPDTP